MRDLIRRTALIFLSACIVFAPSISEASERYDPQHTMLALNMAAVSISKIISTQDRLTLYQEYNNIINNLAIGNIENDREIRELYTEILNFIKDRTLRQDEEKIFRERYGKIQQRQFANSGLNIAALGGSILIDLAADIYMNKRAKDEVIANRDAKKNASVLDWIGDLFGFGSRSAEKIYNTQAEYDARQAELEAKRADLSKMNLSVSPASGAIFEVIAQVGVQLGSWAVSWWLGNEKINTASEILTSAAGKALTGNLIGLGFSVIQGIFSYFGSDARIEAEANRQIFMIEQASINNAARFLGGCSTVCISSYFDYQNSKAELLDDLDIKMWRLKKEDIEDCHKLQVRLLNSAWSLMRRYHLPNDYRLTQENIEYFCKAVEESSPSARMRMFINLEDKFKAYPPYWYYRGQTAHAMNNKAETLYCFRKFDEVYRPVLYRDPYVAEIAKYKVSEISQIESFYKIDALKNEMMSQLDILMKNIAQNDWANYNFAGLGYYAAGKKDKALLCIKNNIDFKTENEISGALLYRMENTSIDIAGLNRELEEICLKNIMAGISDKETAEIFTAYLHGEYDKIPALLKKNVSKPEKNPVLLAVKYLTIRNLASSLEYENELDDTLDDAEYLREESWKSYAEIMPILKFYLERDNDNAEIFAGFMSFYGLGTARNAVKAFEFFSSPAKNGNFYAAYMAGLCCAEREYYRAARKYFVMSSKSAEDFSPANFELGRIYSQGLGVSKDYSIAAEYFKRAAECGHKTSQAKLGDLYYEGGNNFAQSFYNAYVWYQVYEYDDSEEGLMSGTMNSISSNVWRLGGILMGDETPSERIKLIEGYGWTNDPKLSDSEREWGRMSAQEITHRITSKYKFLLVKDENSTAKKVIDAASAVTGIILLILQAY